MSTTKNQLPNSVTENQSTASSWFAILAGLGLAAGFYIAVHFIRWAPLNRYFLGHPVAIAATILFCVAVSVLAFKWIRGHDQWSRLDSLRNEDLAPAEVPAESPSDAWQLKHNAALVAANWLQQIRKLPKHTRASALVSRLDELLVRQSQRGTSKHLADDLREVSARDADNAHDSYGLVRIIIWAIPMLGFLGTVIGITQTLGGLDFTDGTAAVDRLKSGLYVAFDTTALGLVLSVVAIFIQFPVERSEQQLLGEIDARVGHLLSTNIPSDDAADNQTTLVTELCDGIRVAVAESLAHQTKLWRQTIESAQGEWQAVREDNANRISLAFSELFIPALTKHARDMSDYGAKVSKVSVELREKMEQDHAAWLQKVEENSVLLESQQEAMQHQLKLFVATQTQTESMQGQRAEITEQTEAITTMQGTLDANLERLAIANEQAKNALEDAGTSHLPQAMIVLAQAVEALSERLPKSTGSRVGRAA